MKREFRWLALAGTLLPALAQDPTALTPGIAHITAVKGKVSIRHGDGGDWTPVVRNTPLVTNDWISTERGARADVELDPTNALRLTGSGEIRIVRSENEHYEVALDKGAIVYRVTGPSQAIAAVDTPSVSVAPSREGVYRISLDRAGVSEVRADEGGVLVYAPSGSMWVNEGQRLWARGPALDPEFRIAHRRRLWRRMAQILGNIQLAAGIGSAGSAGESSSSAKSSAAKSSNSTNSEKSAESARATPHPSHPSESPKTSAHHESSSHAAHADGGSHASHTDSSSHSSSSASTSTSSNASSSSSSHHGK